jgi:hypothetical protein
MRQALLQLQGGNQIDNIAAGKLGRGGLGVYVPSPVVFDQLFTLQVS